METEAIMPGSATIRSALAAAVGFSTWLVEDVGNELHAAGFVLTPRCQELNSLGLLETEDPLPLAITHAGQHLKLCVPLYFPLDRRGAVAECIFRLSVPSWLRIESAVEDELLGVLLPRADFTFETPNWAWDLGCVAKDLLAVLDTFRGAIFSAMYGRTSAVNALLAWSSSCTNPSAMSAKDAAVVTELLSGLDDREREVLYSLAHVRQRQLLAAARIIDSGKAEVA